MYVPGRTGTIDDVDMAAYKQLGAKPAPFKRGCFYALEKWGDHSRFESSAFVPSLSW